MDQLLRELEEQDIWEGLADVFAKHDKSRRGELNEFQLQEAMKDLGIELSDEDVKAVFYRADLDGSGCVDIDELFLELERAWLKGEEIPEKMPSDLFREAINKMLADMEVSRERFSDVKEVIEGLDSDGDPDFLNYGEFKRCLKHMASTLDDGDKDACFRRLGGSRGKIAVSDWMSALAAIVCILQTSKGRDAEEVKAQIEAGSEELFNHTNRIWADIVIGRRARVTDPDMRPHLFRKGPDMPDQSPGEPIECPMGGDDGMPLTFVCEEQATRMNLSKTEALLSSVAYERLKDGSGGDIWFENVNGMQLTFVIEYLKRHKGRSPPELPKPITGHRRMLKVMEENGGDPWDAIFVDKFLRSKQRIYDFILGCYYMGVRDGLYLGCCKLATLAPEDLIAQTDKEIADWIQPQSEKEESQAEQGLAAAWGL